MNIGDKIFYAMHGAGIVKEIDEKVIWNKTEKFFVIEIPFEQNLHIFVKEDNVNSISYRRLVDHTNKQLFYA